MLNPFPQLLEFSFFAPTLLRVAVALTFFYLAYSQFNRRTEISKLNVPMASTFGSLAAVFHAAIGTSLLVGYYTQWGALIGGLALIVGPWLNRRHPTMVILSNGTVLLMLLICVSLLFSGAGALAFDLPL